MIKTVGLKVRRYLLTHLLLSNSKRLAFGIALTSCLSAGSIVLFSLFLSSLHETFGFSYLQLNFIASLSAMGTYFSLPVLGYLADSYGPSLLSILSIWFFCPSYFISSWLVSMLANNGLKGDENFYIYGFGISFFFVGLATASLYFALLLTCAKIYPERKGLAISLPVSCYGLSSLIGSQLLTLDYFKQNEEALDLYKVFTFFGTLYFFIGVLNFISNCVVMVEQDVLYAEEVMNDEEAVPLNPPAAKDRGPKNASDISLQLIPDLGPHNAGHLTPYMSDGDLQNNLIPTRSVEPPNHHTRYLAFVKDKSAWLLLIVLVLNLGPMESYQNNLGSIIKNTKTPVSLLNEISIMAAASTISRLSLGVLSDWISSTKRKQPVCRVWLLFGVIILGVIAQWVPFGNYTVVTILNGTTYGGLFTIYPTIVALIWGIDMMGSTWGSFMVAPAMGSVVYSLFYGKQVDLRCVDGREFGLTGSCLSLYFQLTGATILLSAALLLFIWKAFWVKRGFALF